MRRNNLLLNFLVLVTFGFVSVSGQTCVDSAGRFKSNSTYETSRRVILSSLASNVISRDGFFYSSSIGQELGRVFAMGLCIPGSESKVCSKCITGGVSELLKHCRNQTEGFAWPGIGTLCMVRYAKRSFVGSLDLEPATLKYDTRSITNNVSKLGGTWDAFMLRMIEFASKGRDGASSASSGKYYAADVTSLATFQRAYALMACTPDLSSANCEACLLANVRDYQNCCRANTGGTTFRPSCYARWDLRPFLGAFDNLGKKDRAAKRNQFLWYLGFMALVVLAVPFLFWANRRRDQPDEVATNHTTGDEITRRQSSRFAFKTIEDATFKFAIDNRLGGGGFGEVFKGTLPNGTEIAVKRLSQKTGQGEEEFNTEASLVGKLQHRNLVNLLGFCEEGVERILVYEFLAKKSLDYLLFGRNREDQLDWRARYKIITGIAQGILYLHEDSRLTIIHRDLKASNILLDAGANPKIADFGLAKTIGVDQSHELTRKIVGTPGYMAPEYRRDGHYSTKSDIYSFGVLILEIISGKQNSSFYRTDSSAINLITYAWMLWRNKSSFVLLDPAIGESYNRSEVTRCIRIALLCLQEEPMERPSISRIIVMLKSNTETLPAPLQPGYYVGNTRDEDLPAVAFESGQSFNDASMSVISPR